MAQAPSKTELTCDEKNVSIANSEMHRHYWDQPIQFFLASLGYCVGLGGLIRFPYLVMKNGGGAFLIPVLCMVIIGSPLYYLEIILGQFSGRSPLTVWALCPAFRGMGYSMTILSIIGAYYYMPLTWSTLFLVSSLNTKVPWSDCSNHWNTPQCGLNSSMSPALYNSTEAFWNTSKEYNDEFNNGSSSFYLPDLAGNGTFLPNASTVDNIRTIAPSPSEEYWNYYILGVKDKNEINLVHLGTIRWQMALSHFFCWGFVFICCMKGAISAGKVVYFTATLPYFLLVALMIRGVTLEGSMDGIIYYLKPDFSKLKEATVWAEAAVQVFFQLGPAWGSLITMASYNKFHHPCYREAVLVPACNFATAFFNGFAIFSVLGFMAHQYKVPIADVARSGPGLAFVAYPAAIAQMPWSPFWAVIFFLTLVCLGIDTQFGMFDAFLSGVFDAFPKLRRRQVLVTGILSCVAFLISLPLCTDGGIYLYTLIDWYSTAVACTLICFCECIVIVYIYGVDRFYSDVTLMFGSPPSIVFKAIWGFFAPVAMAALTINGVLQLRAPEYKFTDYQYPGWAVAIGWFIAFLPTIPTPVILIYTLLKTSGATWTLKFKRCFSPHRDWVPDCPELIDDYRKQWYPNTPSLSTDGSSDINSSFQPSDDADHYESTPLHLSASFNEKPNQGLFMCDV